MITPAQRVLLRTADVAVETERLAFELERAAMTERLVKSVARQLKERNVLSRTASDVADLEIVVDDPALTSRRIGETTAPLALVHFRRTNERLRKRAAAETAMRRQERTVVLLDAEVAALRDMVERRFAARCARVRRIQQHVQRRLAAYRRSLIRHHSQGAAIDGQIGTPDFAMPPWMDSPWNGSEDRH
jgi:hypothetical protein